MKNIKGNLFEQKADAICITTNGFRKANGECVMGRGCALEAAKKWPALPLRLGGLIAKHGNRVMVLGGNESYRVVSFPVKPISEVFNGSNAVGHMASRFRAGDKVPGWACKADLEIIKESATQLSMIADKRNWTKVVLPRPGCGCGELKWETVEPILESILDDRFYCITF